MSEVYIVSRNGKLNTQNGTLNYTDYEGNCQTIFPHLTDSISSVGTLNITSSALQLLISEQIPIFFMGHNGMPKGRLSFAAAKNVFLRQKQYLMLSANEKRFRIAKSIVMGKVNNQRRFLQRIDGCEEAVDEMKYILTSLEHSSDINEIRGIEGSAAHLYFISLKSHIPSWLNFNGRNKNPPKDPFNSVLSFLYTLISYRIEGYVDQEGLDPAVGVLHELSYGRNSLVCDLMEEFRVPLADAIACALFNRGQLSASDFHIVEDDETEAEKYPVYLEKSAVKAVIEAFENKLQKEVIYPRMGHPVPYWKIMKHQVHHFRKVLEGEEEEYIPMYFR